MRRRRWKVPLGFIALCLPALAGCQTKHTITVEPITIEPIYLTVDVHVRLDKELEEAFGYQDRIESELSATSPAVSQPASSNPGEEGAS